MIPIIIPVGATRDQITEFFIGTKLTTKEIILGLRNTKQYFNEQVKNSISNNQAYTKKINMAIPTEIYEDPIAIQQGGQPIDPVTGEIVRRATGQFAKYVPVAQAIQQIPIVGDIFGGIILGGLGGALRTQTPWGTFVGAISGGAMGCLKAAANTVVPGSGYAVQFAAVVIDIAVGAEISSGTVNTVNPTVMPTPTPTPSPFGGALNDPEYMKDIANLTEGIDEIFKELKLLMGSVYFDDFLQKCKEIYKNKKVHRKRVIELEDIIFTMLYLFDAMESASIHKNMNLTNNFTKNTTRKNKI